MSTFGIGPNYLGPDSVDRSTIVAYHWGYDSNLALKLIPGQTTFRQFTMPTTTQAAGRSVSSGWSGGEVNQKNGHIYLTGNYDADFRNTRVNDDGVPVDANNNPITPTGTHQHVLMDLTPPVSPDGTANGVT
jgi:hypothetical protein